MNVYGQMRVGELGLAQQLVLLTLRSLNEQHAGRLGMCVPNALWSVFGPAYVELALRGIEGAHRVMSMHARRTPDLLRPVDARITRTEACLLELLAATAHGQDEYGDGLCQWLVLPAGTQRLKRCVGLAVRALNYRRLVLPVPACACPASPLSDRLRLVASRRPKRLIALRDRGNTTAARR